MFPWGRVTFDRHLEISGDPWFDCPVCPPLTRLKSPTEWMKHVAAEVSKRTDAIKESSNPKRHTLGMMPIVSVFP